jgi:hypothetical protein
MKFLVSLTTIISIFGFIYLHSSLGDVNISSQTRDQITGFDDYVEMHKVSVVCKNGTEDCKIVD